MTDLSIYIARAARGQGIGKLPLRALEARAKQNAFHTIVLFALARNDAGTALYRASGYRDVGTFREQGRLEGVATDVIAMEKLL